MQENSFLGKGWSFPPSFSRQVGGVEMIGGEDDIRESLYILLTTVIGERVMQPDFGCDLNIFVFENFDTSLKTLIADTIETAVLYYEPRIDMESIKIDWSETVENCIEINMFYTVRTTNSRTNLVFPFYLKE